jgi:hypothetical protein
LIEQKPGTPRRAIATRPFAKSEPSNNMNGHTFNRPCGRLPHHFDWLMLLASIAMIGWIVLPR